MTNEGRPPIYWKTWLVGGPGLLGAALLSVVSGRAALAIGVVALGVAVFFVPWPLAPQSKIARSLTRPTDENLARTERLSDRLGSVPLFGTVWRWAQRMTRSQVQGSLDDYRRWRDSDDGQTPNA